MASTVEFGIRLPVAGPLASRESITRASSEAERLGLDALWVHDFIIWTAEQDRTHVSCGSLEAVERAAAQPGYQPQFYESLMSLAYLAGVTQRIKIGVAVLCLPFRNPIVTAKQVATLDQLSGGRLILGVGVGAPKGTLNQDFEILGVPRGDKYRRTTEYLRIMRAIWTQEHPSFQGQYVSFPPTDINPKPAQKPHPPIWFGGRGDKAMEITSEFADGWLPGGLAPKEYPEYIARLKEGARAKGRGDVDFTIAMEVVGCVARTREQALKRADHTIQAFPEAYAAYGSMEVVLKSSLIGSVDEVRDKVVQFAEGGVNHFEIKFIYNDIDELVEQMTLLTEEIAPAVR